MGKKIKLISGTNQHNLPKMQAEDCRKVFNSASSLLQHFALHASDTLSQPVTPNKKLPDLYPIKFSAKGIDCSSDMESDSGVEDVNPMKFCMVTMAEEGEEKARKYQCQYCSRKFGWPTDLKRHILIHTGERPFQCQSCDSSFTRNFLLKKHERRCHDEVPELKPLRLRRKK